MEMTIQLNRASPILSRTVGVAMPLTGDFVIDTFSRVGDLTTPGELGATWSPVGSTDLAADFGIDGTALYSKSGSFVHAYPSGVPPSPNYGVEAIFTFDPAVYNDLRLNLYSRLTNPAAGGDTTSALYWRALTGDVSLEAYDLGFINDPFVDLGNVGPTVAGTYKLVAEVNGNTLRAYLDAVLLGALDISSVSSSGIVGVPVLEFNDISFGTGPLANTASLQIESFRCYPL